MRVCRQPRRPTPTETPYANRDALYDCFPISIWDNPADDEAHIAWARELWDAMTPKSRDLSVTIAAASGGFKWGTRCLVVTTLAYIDRREEAGLRYRSADRIPSDRIRSGLPGRSSIGAHA